MARYIFIALGGALGSVARYAMQDAFRRWYGETFPAGTLAVNLLGCLVIGVLAAAFAGPIALREDYRLGLMVGVLGGFTTFSAFGLETFSLATKGQTLSAIAYISASVVFGLVAVWLGFRATERWFAT